MTVAVYPAALVILLFAAGSMLRTFADSSAAGLSTRAADVRAAAQESAGIGGRDEVLAFDAGLDRGWLDVQGRLEVARPFALRAGYRAEIEVLGIHAGFQHDAGGGTTFAFDASLPSFGFLRHQARF